MYTWKDYKTLHRIPEGISRWANERTLYSVRCNSENAIEYTTEKPYESLPSFSCPFKTSAGFVILKNRGEFGGGLQIGCEEVLSGNFSSWFSYGEDNYVIDTVDHLGWRTFRIVKVNDDGSIAIIYDANQSEESGMPEIGLDAYYEGKGANESDVKYFLCSGEVENPEQKGRDAFTNIQYLLIFDKNKEYNPFVRIELPVEKVEYGFVSSIWSDGKTLAIGCQNQVVLISLPTMDVEYWTELDRQAVEEALEWKHKSMQKPI